MHLRTFTAWIAVHIHFIEENVIDIVHYCITVLVLSMQLFYRNNVQCSEKQKKIM